MLIALYLLWVGADSTIPFSFLGEPLWCRLCCLFCSFFPLLINSSKSPDWLQKKKLDLWGKDCPTAFSRKKEELSHTGRENPPNPHPIRTQCPYPVRIDDPRTWRDQWLEVSPTVLWIWGGWGDFLVQIPGTEPWSVGRTSPCPSTRLSPSLLPTDFRSAAVWKWSGALT